MNQPGTPLKSGATKIRRPLDALNFFLADVRGGLGPCLAVYLLTIRHWDEAGDDATLAAVE